MHTAMGEVRCEGLPERPTRLPGDSTPVEPDVCEQPIIPCQQAAQVVPLSAALLPGAQRGAPVGQD